MMRWEVINAFIEKYKYKSYCELGYYKGWSFDQVKCDLKIAVDPNPSKTQDQQNLSYGRHMPADPDKFWLLEKMTSDDFFNMIHGGVEFDLIFIDGLHEASQVEKDINNALNHLSPGGTIVLHDMNPPTYEHTTTGDKHGNWNGDCYKAFVKFRLQFPEYESYTIDTDWGCGVIHDKLIRDWTIETPAEEVSAILEWDYFNANRRYLLGLISVEEFKTKLNEGTTDTDSTT